MFNIIEPNSRLIIDYLAEAIEEWSQEMLQLLKVRSRHEKTSVTFVLYNLFHMSKFMRIFALNFVCLRFKFSYIFKQGDISRRTEIFTLGIQSSY